MPGVELFLHLGPAKIDVPIDEPQLLARLLGTIHLKRRRLRYIENLQPLSGNFDFPGRQLRVLHALTSGLNQAFGCNDPFAAGRLCQFVYFRLGLGVENNLCQTFPVTQVNEYQIAVVAIGMDPYRQRNFFAGVFQPKLAAIMCSLKHY